MSPPQSASLTPRCAAEDKKHGTFHGHVVKTHPHAPIPAELLYALHPKNSVKLRDAEKATATRPFRSNAPSSSTSLHTQMHRFPLLAQMNRANDPWFAAHGLPWNAEDPIYEVDETAVPEGLMDEAW